MLFLIMLDEIAVRALTISFTNEKKSKFYFAYLFLRTLFAVVTHKS